MKEIVLDTETTGLSVKDGHRIVEIGCIELDDLVPTKNIFHFYLNPERKVSEKAFEVHGYSDEFLSTKPKFEEIADEFLDFIKDKKIIQNSDKRFTDLLLGHFYAENFDKLIEIAKKIEHHNFQSWLFFHYAKQQLDLLNKDDNSFEQGLQEYAKDDWPLLLDRLHIPQDEIKQKLSDFLATI